MVGKCIFEVLLRPCLLSTDTGRFNNASIASQPQGNLHFPPVLLDACIDHTII